AEGVTLDPRYEASAGTPMAFTSLGEIFLPIAAADQARERQRLGKEIARMEDEARTAEAKLQDNALPRSARATVGGQDSRWLDDLNAQLEKLKQAREGLS